MSEPSAAPAGWHTITPRIAVSDARGLVDFLAQVFAAVGAYENGRPSIVRIGDSVIMISEAGSRDFTPAFLYVYVGNTDATCARGAGRSEDGRGTVRHALRRSPLHVSRRVGQYLAGRKPGERQGVGLISAWRARSCRVGIRHAGGLSRRNGATTLRGVSLGDD
jgi:hypothetical protein